MTHRELCRRLAHKRSLTLSTAAEAVDAVLDCIKAAVVRGERVEVRGFGSFFARHLAARSSPHPQTGDERWLPSRRAPAFRASPAWRQRLQRKNAPPAAPTGE